MATLGNLATATAANIDETVQQFYDNAFLNSASENLVYASGASWPTTATNIASGWVSNFGSAVLNDVWITGNNAYGINQVDPRNRALRYYREASQRARQQRSGSGLSGRTISFHRYGEDINLSVLQRTTSGEYILPVNDHPLSVEDVRLAMRDLGRANERDMVAVVHPEVAHQLMGDASFVSAQRFNGQNNLYEGEIGELYGVRFVTSPDALRREVTFARPERVDEVSGRRRRRRETDLLRFGEWLGTNYGLRGLEIVNAEDDEHRGVVIHNPMTDQREFIRMPREGEGVQLPGWVQRDTLSARQEELRRLAEQQLQDAPARIPDPRPEDVIYTDYERELMEAGSDVGPLYDDEEEEDDD